MKQNTNNKIKSFTDLRVWKEGHNFVLNIYRITKSFPRDERFGLISQLRRASVSITSNIAEGFTRRTNKEKKQFYFNSLGSLVETQNQLLIARDIQYITHETFRVLALESIEISKMINGLIKSFNKVNYCP